MLSRLFRRTGLLMLSMAASIVAGRFLLDQIERDRQKHELLSDVEISTIPISAAAPRLETISSASKEDTATKKAPLAKGKDDFMLIEGIGPAYKRALLAAGIHSFAELAAQKPADLIGKLQPRVSLERVRNWIKQAKQLSNQ
jgi:predicted flap endonuclease-1-like 5' DNA nuclease